MDNSDLETLRESDSDVEIVPEHEVILITNDNFLYKMIMTTE